MTRRKVYSSAKMCNEFVLLRLLSPKFKVCTFVSIPNIFTTVRLFKLLFEHTSKKSCTGARQFSQNKLCLAALPPFAGNESLFILRTPNTLFVRLYFVINKKNRGNLKRASKDFYIVI